MPQPAVTYANVGELAVDVLVATVRPQSLGAVESVDVLPVVGNDAYDVDQQAGRLATALELFAVPGKGRLKSDLCGARLAGVSGGRAGRVRVMHASFRF